MASRIVLNRVQGTLVATIPTECGQDAVELFWQDLARQLEGLHSGGLILDFSGTRFLDISEFNAFNSLCRRASLLGVKSVMAGLQPHIVAGLIELGAEGACAVTALSVDHAFDHFGQGAD